MMANGNIIFLNGTSSSGKAAIARQLQEILEEPYLYFSVDSFLHMLPERFMSTEDSEPTIENEKILSEMMPGIISAIHHSIRTFASRGHNLIVDHVMQNQDWLVDCIKLLEEFPVLFVGVRCRLKELDRRERQRDMVRGLARQQYEIVHAHGIYDLEVDTADYGPLECAQQIKQALENGLSGQAFSKLKQEIVKKY
jgi:chloramphenicol 3-O phosphotransferase